MNGARAARRPIVRRRQPRLDWERLPAPRRPVDLIAPDGMDLKLRDYLVSGRTYVRHLAVIAFPAGVVRFGYLTELVGGSGVNVVQVVDPVPDGAAQRFLGRSRRAARSTLRETEDVAAAEVGLTDVERTRLKVARGQERLFRYGIYVQVTALSEEELDERTRAVEARMNGLGLRTVRCAWRQKRAQDAFVPVGIDPLAVYNLVDTSTVACGFFFASPTVAVTGERPIFYGLAVDRRGNTAGPVLVDPFAPTLTNPHAAVLATSGAGKSYLLKSELLQGLAWGRRYFVVDPEHEYQGLARALGGTFVRLAAGTADRVNPLDLPHLAAGLAGDAEERDPLMEKVLSLAGWLEAVLSPRGALAPAARGALEEAIVATYAARGITADLSTQRREPPLLEELAPHLAERLPDLAPALERMVRGTLQVFNGRTNVDLSAPLVVYGFRDADTPELENLASLLAFDQVWSYARSRPDPAADPISVVVDEGWTLLQSTAGGQMLANTIRRGRKYDLRLVLATQKVEDVVSSAIGRTVINLCHARFLLSMGTEELRRATEAFGLAPGEVEFLASCTRTEQYADCLLLLGRQHTGLRILRAPEAIHRLLTSRPGEWGRGRRMEERA